MDKLLSSADVEEALSLAYVHAIAAGAGYVVAHRNFDRDGVDATIEAGGSFRPKLDVQLKATINLLESDDGFRYPLKKRNYDPLIGPTQVPRILIVLHLPDDPNEWVQVTPEELALRGCAYWATLRAEPESENATSVTISLSAQNRFNVTGLKGLMEQSRTGRIG